MPREVHLDHGNLAGVRDSKVLTPATRAELLEEIKARAVAFGVGIVGADQIDDIGIVPATRKAMATAVASLGLPAEYLLIDYLTLKEIDLPQKGITYGDSLCFSIAAASIVAKVTRDRLMEELDALHPGFGFAHNKGYGTSEHLTALGQIGPCAIHRRTFGPVQQCLLGADPSAD
jgi:ribonuclease HII